MDRRMDALFAVARSDPRRRTELIRGLRRARLGFFWLATGIGAAGTLLYLIAVFEVLDYGLAERVEALVLLLLAVAQLVGAVWADAMVKILLVSTQPEPGSTPGSP